MSGMTLVYRAHTDRRALHDARRREEVFGLWIEQTDGAKFSLKVMNELKTRGVADILIAWYIGADADPLVEP